MLRVYHRIKINEGLLTPETINIDDANNVDNLLKKYLTGKVKDTLPAGKVVGVTWNPYSFQKIEEETPNFSAMESLPFMWSQTDIDIYDSRGQKVTATTDISDYRHKSGGHLKGIKNVHMLNKEDSSIAIEWKTLGITPICGEFVFTIEQEDCECL